MRLRAVKNEKKRKKGKRQQEQKLKLSFHNSSIDRNRNEEIRTEKKTCGDANSEN